MSTRSQEAGRARSDGRDSRWEGHRRERRQQLVEATLRAIREHGPQVGMDEISAMAGTSKTVVYRHLGDRRGLYLAVCEHVDATILADVRRALSGRNAVPSPESTDNSLPRGSAAKLRSDPRAAIAAVTDGYLRLVERDPEVYRFVTRRPLGEVPVEQDPVIGMSDTIAAALADSFAPFLSPEQRERGDGLVWAHALVGAVRESADRWMVSPQRRPRQTLVDQLADLGAHGLAGVLRGSEPDITSTRSTPSTQEVRR